MRSIATSPLRTPVDTPTRKKKLKVLSNAEKQARFRAKRDARLRELEEQFGLRNQTPLPPVIKLRNQPIDADTLDDALARLRRRGDQLVADYIQLAVAPGLSLAELDTIVARFADWRNRVKAVRHVAPRAR